MNDRLIKPNLIKTQVYRDLRGDIHLLLGGVSLVRLGKLLGEEDKLRAVLLQALNVLLKRLNALVAATVINGDADGSEEGERRR